jgi:hypothetical protein
MEEDNRLLSQRSLFKVSKLGFPVDFYQTKIGLVIMNILFPNTIPGIDNPKRVFGDIIGSYKGNLQFNILTKIRNLGYILGIDLLNYRFKTIKEVTKFSPLLDDFIHNKIKNNLYLPNLLFLMKHNTRKIEKNVFEVSISNPEIDDPSRKYGLQFSNNGILSITIDNEVYTPNKSKAFEYEWAKFVILKFLIINFNTIQHGVCGHFPFHNIGYIYKQTIPDDHSLGIFFNYLMGSSYGLVFQTQMSATSEENSFSSSLFTNIFTNPYIKGNEFALQTINPFTYVNSMLNTDIQCKEVEGLSELLKTIKKYIFRLVKVMNKENPIKDDIYVLQFWRLLHSYYKDLPKELNVKNLSYVLYSCILFTISHSIFHENINNLFTILLSSCKGNLKNSDKNILSLLPNKIEMYFSLYETTLFQNDNLDTLFQLKNIYPKNNNLNMVMNELSDKVTHIIKTYNLSYIKHGILQ